MAKTTISNYPINQLWVTRILLMLVIILAVAAGYYQELWKQELKRYARLEDKYVRVRQVIGRESMQELIDESYELE